MIGRNPINLIVGVFFVVPCQLSQDIGEWPGSDQISIQQPFSADVCCIKLKLHPGTFLAE